MNFRQWMKYTRRNLEYRKQVFAKASLSKGHAYQISCGKRYPSYRLAKRLEKASGGEMTTEELLEGVV